jgi:transcriptional regulator with XRE-family HTH domain
MLHPQMDPGFRLRQIRERLGLTYRDVERASLALARVHTRPQFTVHISRLADIENGGVVPSLHKLYALAVVYHLNPLKILEWYDIPLDRFLGDAVSSAAPQTHLMASLGFSRAEKLVMPLSPECTEFLARNAAEYTGLRNILNSENGHHRYGCIGLRDRRMEPILRPGSVVLVDVSVRRLQESDWSNEYDRPMYFVELHDGYRCGWFQQEGARLAMQPHPLSRCMPESWKTPDDAEIVGRVVGVVTRLPVPLKSLSRESPELHGHSSKKAL